MLTHFLIPMLIIDDKKKITNCKMPCHCIYGFELFWASPKMFEPITKTFFTYHKVASSNTSRLEALAGFFRLLIKWIFLLLWLSDSS